MLFFGNYFAVVASNYFGYAGAGRLLFYHFDIIVICNMIVIFLGPLAVISTAFICSYNWSQQGWKVQENPVANIFRLLWVVFEPTLFGITGAQVKVNYII